MDTFHALFYSSAEMTYEIIPCYTYNLCGCMWAKGANAQSNGTLHNCTAPHFQQFTIFSARLFLCHDHHRCRLTKFQIFGWMAKRRVKIWRKLPSTGNASSSSSSLHSTHECGRMLFFLNSLAHLTAALHTHDSVVCAQET